MDILSLILIASVFAAAWSIAAVGFAMLVAVVVIARRSQTQDTARWFGWPSGSVGSGSDDSGAPSGYSGLGSDSGGGSFGDGSSGGSGGGSDGGGGGGDGGGGGGGGGD